jgi:hypothetical protein
MRLVPMSFLLVATACGGAKAADPAASPRPAVKTFDEHATRLDELATRACECSDRRCIAAIDRELADLVTSIPLGPVEPATATKLGPTMKASLERLSVCMTDREVAAVAYGPALANRIEDVSAAICACSDADCAKSSVASLMPEFVTADSFPVEDPSWKRMNVSARKARECSRPWSAPDQALAELGALRTEACACTSPDCAATVQASFDAFLERHKDTVGSEEQAVLIGNLAKEMSACLAAARGEPPE